MTHTPERWLTHMFLLRTSFWTHSIYSSHIPDCLLVTVHRQENSLLYKSSSTALWKQIIGYNRAWWSKCTFCTTDTSPGGNFSVIWFYDKLCSQREYIECCCINVAYALVFLSACDSKSFTSHYYSKLNSSSTFIFYIFFIHSAWHRYIDVFVLVGLDFTWIWTQWQGKQ